MGICDVVQGRLDDAERWLDQAEWGRRGGNEPATALLVLLARGMLNLALGRLDHALEVLGEVDGLQAKLVTTHVLTVQARWFALQTHLKLGDLASARGALDALSDEEREWGEAAIGTASFLLAEGDPRGALERLVPVLDGSVSVLRDLSIVEALLVDALAHEQLGDKTAVEADVERALELAEPEGLVFPFITLPVKDILQRHPRFRTAHAGLLSVILDAIAGSPVPLPPGRPGEPVADLSDSELRVLRFLPSNLSAPEIGAELYLSTSTVKTHMRHIYAKLEVHSRTEAVERARHLGLLGPSSRVRR